MEEWLRNREIDRLGRLVENGELTPEEAVEEMEEWEDGYALSQEELREARCDR